MLLVTSLCFLLSEMSECLPLKDRLRWTRKARQRFGICRGLVSFARTVVWSKRILVKYNYTVYFVVHPVFDGTSRSDRTIARSLGFRKPRAHVASYTVLSPFRERVFPSCGTKRSLVAFLWGDVGRSVDFFNFGISHSVDETEPVSHLFCFSFVAVISLLDIEIIDGSCCRIDRG